MAREDVGGKRPIGHFAGAGLWSGTVQGQESGLKRQLAGFCVAAAAIAWGTGGHAHHPGSHATREPDGEVRVDAVAMAADACTTIGAIRIGTPPSITPAPGSEAVTVSLTREGEACAAVVTATRAEEVLQIAPEAKQILLYFLGPDGSLLSTERVPIR